MTERQRFRDQIVASFSMEELETLCRDLGVDPDVIPGKDEGKEIWADQIITYFERRGKVPALLAALRHQRSDQTWGYTPASISLPDVPRKLPIGLIAGGAALAVLVIVGGLVVLRPPATQAPPTNVAPTIAPIPTVAPQKMPALKTNIFVADFGQMQDGKAVTISEGTLLSDNLVESLKLELNDSTVLPAAVRSDFQPEVWSNADARAKGWQIGPIATLTEAQQVGEQLGAQVVIYGNVISDSGASRLQLDFYVPQALKTADELAGGYAIGKAIPMQWPPTEDVLRGVKFTLNERQRLISRLAIGITYDQSGQSKKALDIFTRASADIDPACGSGREVLQFFIGREQLLLGNSEDAAKAHTEAVNCNSNFARALIGLADANFQAAGVLSPEVRLESEALQAAYDNYALAEQKALAEGHMQLATLAQLGTGLTRQLAASTHFRLGDYEQVQPLSAEAIKLLVPALNELSKRPDGQKRTLAIGYSSLGTAYWYNAQLTPESDTTTAKKFFEQARDSYNKCIALVPAGTEAADPMLTEKLVQSCKNNLEKMTATMPDS